MDRSKKRYNNCKYICTPLRSTSIYKANAKAIKGEINNDTIIAENFNASSTSMHGSSRKKSVITNIILNTENFKSFPLRSGKKQRCPLLPQLFNTLLEVLAMIIREKKRNKRNPKWKRKSKTAAVCRCLDLNVYYQEPSSSAVSPRSNTEPFEAGKHGLGPIYTMN